ncbi:hypothetical protein ACJX0J_035537, partial [Zea mays]
MHFFLHCLALCTYKEICCCAPLYVKYFHPAFSSNTVTDKHPLCCSTTKLHVLPLLVIVKTFILTRIPFPFMYHTTAHSISSLYFKILINSIEDLSQALNTCFARHNYIGSEHLLLGLLREGEGVVARVLESLGADPSNIRTQVIRMIGETTEAVGAGVGGGSSGNKMPTLEEYGTNLTKLAKE